MADKTKIEWTDATWNPITGCSVVSPGCTNCYAMRLAGTRLKHHPTREGLTTMSNAGPVWNGTVLFNEAALLQPLRWKRPRMIFVCAHGDLFAENVPDDWIDHVFAVMALAPQHTFQVLTKRPERMRAYCGGLYERREYMGGLMAEIGGEDREGWYAPEAYVSRCWVGMMTPLPNVWLGVSVEDQNRADERIPVLLDTPATVRFISGEPLLGRIDLDIAMSCEQWRGRLEPGVHNTLTGEWWAAVGNAEFEAATKEVDLPKLDWVIAGGESGPGARPMHPDWARSLRDQCADAGVPFFFKQWGEWLPMEQSAGIPAPNIHQLSYDVFDDPRGSFHTRAYKVGKARAGRLLDGVEHNAMPSIDRRAA